MDRLQSTTLNIVEKALPIVEEKLYNVGVSMIEGTQQLASDIYNGAKNFTIQDKILSAVQGLQVVPESLKNGY